MNLVRVESSNLSAVGYDPDISVLAVRFTNGSVCNYYGVPPYEHTMLMAAKSKGKYLAEHIKGMFPYARIEG